MELLIKSLKDLPTNVKAFLDFISEEKIILFKGEMGAGKTTFIKEVCVCLGVKDNISSPTYSLVNEYEGEQKIIYHFDFYRINHEEEALDIGVEEYFESGNLCLIEWPSKIENILPSKFVLVDLLINEDGTRTLKLLKHG